MSTNNSNRYVLLTAARNEEAYIRKTIESVVSQTVPPVEWLIVSDGSTDRTEEIIREYLPRVSFLHLERVEPNEYFRGFGSKVNAITHAETRIDATDHDFIGILDADIGLDPKYYENILDKFHEDQTLGISGGYIYERNPEGVFHIRMHNRQRCVAGAIQLFRRECYRQVGGITSIEYGGEDTYAEILARINGWNVLAFPEFPVYHYKSGNLKRGLWKDRIRMGRLDYVMGYHPVYEVLKFLVRLAEPPPLIGATIRLAGYMGAMSAGLTRVPSPEVIRHIRMEQWKTIGNFFRSWRIS